MRLFLMVFDRGSVSRAAEDLDLNQSTVSHGLDRLRAILGDPLFVRVGRGIEASEVAIGLEPRIRQIVSEMEGLILREEYRPEDDRQPVTIACNVTELLPELVAFKNRLGRAAPNAPLHLIDLGVRTNTASLLASGEADLVITVRLPTYPASVLHEAWLRDYLAVYYDPTQRGPIETVQDFAASRHAALDFGGGKQSMLTLALQRMGVQRKVALNTANVYALAALMTGSDLITTMQARFRNSALRDFGICPLPVPIEDVIYDVVWHRRRETSPRLRWLLAELRALDRGGNPLESTGPHAER